MIGRSTADMYIHIININVIYIKRGNSAVFWDSWFRLFLYKWNYLCYLNSIKIILNITDAPHAVKLRIMNQTFLS